MKSMRSFLVFFYILDKCYDQCKENDLGGFLGAISPELWEDGLPMDKAVYSDWKEMSNADILNSQNIVKAICDFLELYETQYAYRFSETKKVLNDIIDNEIIVRALEWADIMYQKHAYID